MKYKYWLNEWLALYVKPTTKIRTYKKYQRQIELHLQFLQFKLFCMLTIILYQDTQSFAEAVVIVHLYFYVMVSPAIITADIIKFVKNIGFSK